VKPRAQALGGFKISLHGPDERHAAPGFKLGSDGATPADTATVATVGFLPAWFDGELVAPGVRRVIRIRTTWDLFEDGVPSAPSAGEVAGGFEAHIAEPPPPGYATDIDLFVCEGLPWWPREVAAREANAALGPLKNGAGQWLTGLVVRRAVPRFPTPSHMLGREPRTASDTVRGISAGIGEAGFAWLSEQRLSRKWLVRGGLPPAARPLRLSPLSPVLPACSQPEFHK